MFSNFFFLLLLLVQLSGAPIAAAGSLQTTLLLYLGLLGTLYLLGRCWRGTKERLVFLANLPLQGYFFLSFYIFYAQAAFFHPPKTLLSEFYLTCSTLLLYFSGLLAAHFGYEKRQAENRVALFKAWNSLRFLLPFAWPFLLFVLLSDLSNLLPSAKLAALLHTKQQYAIRSGISLVTALIVLLLVVLFLPPLIISTWGCQKLNHPLLEEHLQQLCRRAGFTHAGFRKWTIMENSMTAAILGMVGRFRYILFSDPLLKALPSESIGAVLAHEIGHSRHKHLLLYPFILAGMFICASLCTLFLFYLFKQHSVMATQAGLLLGFALTMAVYFRCVFGHFSRLFERQADLHIFELNIPAEHMMSALYLTAGPDSHQGNRSLFTFSNKARNWHHYSNRERIDFLRLAAADRRLIASHHRKVKAHLLLFFLLLAAGSYILLDT